MHSKNGPPLSLDSKLRLPHYVSAFPPLPLLRRNIYDLPFLLPLDAVRYRLER